MVPSAVIAGRILDDDGEPLPSVSVSALREIYDRGKRSLVSGANAVTNDLGEYRLFGLAPGRYFVSARYSNWERGIGESEEQAQQSSQGYAKMFYPGTPDRARATTIAVKAGEEIPSIEILMRQVAVYHARGHVFNQVTRRPGTDCFVLLLPRTHQRGDMGETYTIVRKRDGSFDIPDILPGPYTLAGFWFDQGKQYISRTPLDVGNADVEGVAVTIAPGSTVGGAGDLGWTTGIRKRRASNLDSAYGQLTPILPRFESECGWLVCGHGYRRRSLQRDSRRAIQGLQCEGCRICGTRCPGGGIQHHARLGGDTGDYDQLARRTGSGDGDR
jgi:hypothetical protein